jgi:hypothetical protein
MTVAITRIAGASGAVGAGITYQELTANSADNTTVTPAVVMTTTGLVAGTWKFSYYVNAQTAATGTGISFRVAFAGTTTQFYARREYLGTLTTATNGIMDDIAGTNGGQIVEGFSHRTNNTDMGPNAGSATVNTNAFNLIEGFAVTTTTGDLTLAIRSEVAASAVRLFAGSNLKLEKIA